MVSPTLGAGFEKAMSFDVSERLGFTLAKALNANAVEYGSSSHESLSTKDFVYYSINNAKKQGAADICYLVRERKLSPWQYKL
jgi:hypothetical protein